MGQAKHNPVAIAAKKGELSPRPKRIGKREFERQVMAYMMAKMAEKGVPVADIFKNPY